jgi:hypothetical protein
MQNLKEEKKSRLLKLRTCNDSKSVWKCIKRFTKCAGQSYSDAAARITNDQWVSHFKKVLNFSIVGDRPEWHIPNDDISEDFILDSPISSQEVINSINNLKPGKAAGIDGLIPEFWKRVAFSVAALLAHLFTKMLHLGVYPSTWAKSVVIPLYKGKGSLLDPGNYRGISLLCSISKVFTRILNNRLTRWLMEHNQIVEEQAGFRKGYSTIDNCFILETLIETRLAVKGQKLYACFIDFRKAFDCVPRTGLWYKMYKIGIKGKFLRLLMNMYDKCKFAVRISRDAISEEEVSTSGVFQGCVLSPSLFKIFINDLIRFCSGDNLELGPGQRSCNKGSVGTPMLDNVRVPSLLFADDLGLFSCSVEGLQCMLNRVAEYANYWGLEVNVDKTFCMVFRKGGRCAKRETWNYQGKQINIVNRFKYLGLRFSSCHSWTFHIETVVKQAIKVVLLLRRLIYSTGDLPLQFLWHIYDTAIAPIALYGSEVWGHRVTPHIEKVDSKFAKMILRLPQGTPSAGLFLLLNRNMSCYWKAKQRMLNYWARLTELPDYRLVKIAYYEQLRLAEEGMKCWAADVQQLLCDNNMEDVWIARKVSNLTTFAKRLSSELSYRAFAETLAEANTKPSLTLFLSEAQKSNNKLECPEILDLPPLERRLILAGKLNLPTFIDFTTIDGARVKTCKLCKNIVNDSWSHLVWECVSLAPARLCCSLAQYSTSTTDASIFFHTPERDYLTDLGSFLCKAWKFTKGRIESNSQHGS